MHVMDKLPADITSAALQHLKPFLFFLSCTNLVIYLTFDIHDVDLAVIGCLGHCNDDDDDV